MKYLLICIMLSMVLVGCSNQTPAEAPYSVTPEPDGRPVFEQPTIEVNVEPNASTTAGDGTYPAPANTETSGYPAPASTETSAYPGPQPTASGSADGRAQTALASYQVALEAAKQNFNPDAQLYAIAPSSIMIANLGRPPVRPGWFYRFRVADSRREYIAQVVDGEISGTSLAESIENPTPPELPLDMAQVTIDSTQVFEQFMAHAAEQNIPTDGITFDLELVSLEGRGGPTWSVVEPNQRVWLYSVSAANGNVVANPHN